ncbi:ribosome maturation factor RimP [Clostridium felsineum]|uniref:Ribosome maturation factor RimP n=1 Tax=Clostridium felsineum TaxID=36839 RepID=A0A1S8L4Z4_9CLOT|nr:ribosome maturation factor RimP [Clostridium felsineum]MCR3758544.1 ribosome maturation factor RimP [Clostridium felsineum]URZ00717.1 Ribosome maturation factor RimP [Clostridium felsineum]URZ06644.1 Ribosome maturation factor RimP [Clostridium felsineum]URZ11677.1 Ribosome maturation factor RimP [Clostridium felsineum]URZ16235.1 Ribosome maturation factor RimP [Clostridium felsineum DSM 794]
MIDKLIELIQPVVENLGYEFYHIEIVKEDGERYLRVYIDKESGISLSDCEIVSRAISDLLDDKDPIPYSYYLEVSSPGINRTLFTDNHLKKYIGSIVDIKLKSSLEKSTNYSGKLIDFNEEDIIVTISEDRNLKIPRKKIKKICLSGEF